MTRGFLASPGLIHAPATATSLGARRSSRCSVVSRANVGLSVAGVDMKITDERIAFEERALEAFTMHCGGVADIERAESLLKEAAVGRQVPPTLVSGAMKYLETQDQGKSVGQTREESLGCWLLPFSDIVKFEAWRYIPVTEYLDITETGYTLESNVGPLNAYISGDYEWVDGKAATLFKMPRVKYELFGKTVSEKTKDLSDKPMRCYEYFWVTDSIMCVRTSAGGFTLLYR